MSSAQYFRLQVQSSKVKSVFVESVPTGIHPLISSNTDCGTVNGTKQVTFEGIRFVVGMFVPTEEYIAFLEFKEIRNILLIRK